MSNEEMKRAVEAILFAAGESVEISRIAQALELTTKKAENLLEEVKEEFNSQNHGFKIMRYKDSYRFVTHKEYEEQIRMVMDLNRKKPLSQAAMEVLAVIAYNQGVYRIIQLLKEIPQEKRHGKPDQDLPDTPFRHQCFAFVHLSRRPPLYALF